MTAAPFRALSGGAFVLVLAVTSQGIAPRDTAVAACESLASLTLPHTWITEARVVPAGGFALPGTGGAAVATSSDLPAFCRVVATLAPSPDSDVKVEVWLPAANWNGKYQAVGNGGFNGTINYAGMRAALERGYATSSTDTGHEGSSARFALGHPEKLIDYAYRSEHQMTVHAKAVITAFYGSAPRLSYWNGCSAGGKQGLMEAQRYPDDFDGIVAGAPASNWTGRAAQGLWIAQAVHRTAGSEIPVMKFTVLHRAVLAACDGLDGVTDGVLEDPTRCRFDPASLRCANGDAPGCLTPPQIETVRAIYSPVIDPRNGSTIFPGHERGSELGWTTMAGPQPFGTTLEHFRFLVFHDPSWDYRTFNFNTDLAATERPDLQAINALNPDLSAFIGRGGKLIQYHGWSDPQISPGSSVAYYQSVLTAMGGEARVTPGYRLFMVPGMAHCSGGEGPNTFDMLPPLEAWVEQGTAPDRIMASRVTNGHVTRTRPLCPYPQVARYTGTGSTDVGTNFVCHGS